MLRFDRTQQRNFPDRDVEEKLRADAQFASHTQRPAEVLAKLSADRKTETGAPEASRRGGVSLGECIENSFEIFLGNPDAGVLHGYEDHSLASRFRFAGSQVGRDDHFFFVSEFHRVADEIDENLLDAFAVTENHARNPLFNEVNQLDLTLSRIVGEHLNGFLNECREVDRLVFELNFLGFKFRKIENVIDEVNERLSARPHDLDEFFLFARERSFDEKACRSDNAVHRSSDLRAHVGKEVRFGFLCDFRLLLCNLNLLDRLLDLRCGSSQVLRHEVEARLDAFDFRWTCFFEPVVIAALTDSLHAFGETFESLRESRAHENEREEERNDSNEGVKMVKVENAREAEDPRTHYGLGGHINRFITDPRGKHCAE